MSNLETLKQAIENQWAIQRSMLISAEAGDIGDKNYYSGAVDALEEAMVEFDQNWVARLRNPSNKRKFKAGDQVVVVGVTDWDSDNGGQITDPKNPASFDWQTPPRTLIGQIGTVMETFDEGPADLNVRFPWNADNEDCSFTNQDLEHFPAVN